MKLRSTALAAGLVLAAVAMIPANGTAYFWEEDYWHAWDWDWEELEFQEEDDEFCNPEYSIGSFLPGDFSEPFYPDSALIGVSGLENCPTMTGLGAEGHSLAQRWYLIDKSTPRITLDGTVKKINKNPDDTLLCWDDRDWRIHVDPVDNAVLKNHCEQTNANGQIELEIRTDTTIELDKHFPAGTKIRARGYWSEDYGHSYGKPKTELHPLVWMRGEFTEPKFSLFNGLDRSNRFTPVENADAIRVATFELPMPLTQTIADLGRPLSASEYALEYPSKGVGLDESFQLDSLLTAIPLDGMPLPISPSDLPALWNAGRSRADARQEPGTVFLTPTFNVSPLVWPLYLGAFKRSSPTIPILSESVSMALSSLPNGFKKAVFNVTVTLTEPNLAYSKWWYDATGATGGVTHEVTTQTSGHSLKYAIEYAPSQGKLATSYALAVAASTRAESWSPAAPTSATGGVTGPYDRRFIQEQRGFTFSPSSISFAVVPTSGTIRFDGQDYQCTTGYDITIEEKFIRNASWKGLPSWTVHVTQPRALLVATQFIQQSTTAVAYQPFAVGNSVPMTLAAAVNANPSAFAGLNFGNSTITSDLTLVQGLNDHPGFSIHVDPANSKVARLRFKPYPREGFQRDGMNFVQGFYPTPGLDIDLQASGLSELGEILATTTGQFTAPFCVTKTIVVPDVRRQMEDLEKFILAYHLLKERGIPLEPWPAARVGKLWPDTVPSTGIPLIEPKPTTPKVVLDVLEVRRALMTGQKPSAEQLKVLSDVRKRTKDLAWPKAAKRVAPPANVQAREMTRLSLALEKRGTLMLGMDPSAPRPMQEKFAKALASHLKERPRAKVTIAVHVPMSSSVKDDASRATSALEKQLELAGIPKARITIQNAGAGRPLIPGSPRHPRNARLEIRSQ